MKFTRNQIGILAVLAVVTVIMMTGILFIPFFSALSDAPDGGTPSETQPKPHDKFRTARPAFNENLFWETNIGSSGDDYAENVFAVNSKIFIVGAIGQSDLDFEGAGGNKVFVAVLSGNGTPLAYNFFEGTLIKSTLFDDKILIFAKNGDEITAAYSDFEGNLIKRQVLPFDKSHELIDVITDYERNRVCLVLKVFNSLVSTVRLKVVELNALLETSDSALLTHSYDLEYVNAYRHGDGYVIFANVMTPKSAAVVVFEWKNGTSYLNAYECSVTGRKIRAYKCVPYLNGYAAVIIDDKSIPDILLISNSFTPSGLALLNLNETSRIDVYCDNAYYYVYALSDAGLGTLKRFDMEFKPVGAYVSFNFYTGLSAFRVSGKETYFAGDRSGVPSVTVVNNTQGTLFEVAFASVNEKIAFIIPYDGYIMVVAHSSASSIDVGANFGGKDIWVTKLRF